MQSPDGWGETEPLATRCRSMGLVIQEVIVENFFL